MQVFSELYRYTASGVSRSQGIVIRERKMEEMVTDKQSGLKDADRRMWKHYALILFNVIALLLLFRSLNFNDSFVHHEIREVIRNLKISSLVLDRSVSKLRFQPNDNYTELEQSRIQLMNGITALDSSKDKLPPETKEAVRKSREVIEQTNGIAKQLQSSHNSYLQANKEFLTQIDGVIQNSLILEGAREAVRDLIELKEKTGIHSVGRPEILSGTFEDQIRRIESKWSIRTDLPQGTNTGNAESNLKKKIHDIIASAKNRVMKLGEMQELMFRYSAIPRHTTFDHLYFVYESILAGEENRSRKLIILFYFLLLLAWLHVAYLIYEMRKSNRRIEMQARELQNGLEKQKELNEMQRKFVSMVSHEFRTPLAIIDSGAQKLYRRADSLTPAKITEIALKTRSHITKLIELLDSTLHSQRMEAGAMEIMPGPCDLKRVISDICQLQYEIHTRNTIHLDISPLPQEIIADEKLIGHVFTNLISNAVKYSPDGTEVVITGADCGDCVEIEVSDKGVGIPQEEMSSLFTCFYRASTSIGISGTGIGLHLVKNIVDQHRGSIEVTSVVGEGSRFLVRLPKEQPQYNENSPEIVEKVA